MEEGVMDGFLLHVFCVVLSATMSVKIRTLNSTHFRIKLKTAHQVRILEFTIGDFVVRWFIQVRASV